MGRPEVSFIIPTFNEEEYISDCIESIKKQNCSKEIIIVDGGSKDETLNLCDEADLIIENIEGRGKARHRGAKEAKGSYFSFIDADTFLKNNYSDKLLSNMKENEDAVAATSYFEITGYRSQIIKYTCQNLLMKHKKPILPGFNTFVDRNAYKKSKGFEDLPGEDLQFTKEISKYGELEVIPEELVTNSGRRIRKYGLTGTLAYYSYKDIKRKKINLKKQIPI
jgi:glycosyltransferase involved in cell wall biosynthesis